MTKCRKRRGPKALTLSASIAFYCPQAEVFGGRSDGKFVVRLEKYRQCQVLISAGDN
jgi:hypothetical protein